jgi:hypothetical protein
MRGKGCIARLLYVTDPEFLWFEFSDAHGTGLPGNSSRDVVPGLGGIEWPRDEAAREIIWEAP